MIDTDIWCKPKIQKLSKDAKLLYLYCCFNKQCQATGISEMTDETIAFETKLDLEDLPDLFKELEKADIKRLDDTIWVKKFIKNQAKSPKFITHIVRMLDGMSDQVLANKVREYNRDCLGGFTQLNRLKAGKTSDEEENLPY